MIFWFLVFLLFLCVSAGLAGAAWYMAARLKPVAVGPQVSRWWIHWLIKGLGVPAGIWMVMNIGFSWWLQPFMPSVQMARNSGGPWMPEFLLVWGIGILIASSYWSAVTLVWVLFVTGKGTPPEPRKDLKALCWTSFLGLIIPALFLQYFGGWLTFGFAAMLLLAPMAGYAPGLLNPKKLPPMYARAIARMKFGKYNEAEWEIIRELEKREDDFEGWMMLAELYATRFNDLTEAERTVLEVSDQPKLTPSQLSIALHRLADWHLKLGADPEAARRALEMICSRFPHSHLARMAQLRISQLPGSEQELREQQTPRAIPLPGLRDSLDLTTDSKEAPLNTQAARQAADEAVAILEQDPNNVPAREKFARVLAQSLNEPDAAIEQLLLLVNLPDQPELKRAEWLGLVAVWHLKYRQDPVTAQSTLERLIREFPATPQAFAARRKLQLLARREHPS